MDLHNWKEQIFITHEIDELLKGLKKKNIINKKGSNTSRNRNPTIQKR
jgi:hypothetical protein